MTPFGKIVTVGAFFAFLLGSACVSPDPKPRHQIVASQPEPRREFQKVLKKAAASQPELSDKVMEILENVGIREKNIEDSSRYDYMVEIVIPKEESKLARSYALVAWEFVRSHNPYYDKKISTRHSLSKVLLYYTIKEEEPAANFYAKRNPSANPNKVHARHQLVDTFRLSKPLDMKGCQYMGMYFWNDWFDSRFEYERRVKAGADPESTGFLVFNGARLPSLKIYDIKKFWQKRRSHQEL